MPPVSFGRYEVVRELGRGGMGVVYLAHDPKFRRNVAIKALSLQLASDPAALARFDREARAIAALEHGAIVPVHDYGEDTGEPYLVFRFMPGGSLGQRIADGGAQPFATVSALLDRVGRALDYAHSNGVVHRDIKPPNILFDGEGEAWLTDFGIARLAEHTATLTTTGILGSPAYMSPEQCEGEAATSSSDIYSLGCTAFEALTGRPPFVAESPVALLLKHLRAEPPDASALVPSLPADAGAAIAAAMSKAPADRFQSAAAFARALASTAATDARPVPSAPGAPAGQPIRVELAPADRATRVAAAQPAPVDMPNATRIVPRYAAPATGEALREWTVVLKQLMEDGRHRLIVQSTNGKRVEAVLRPDAVQHIDQGDRLRIPENLSPGPLLLDFARAEVIARRTDPRGRRT